VRWTSSVRNLFLLPAVTWVPVFIIFPPGYSLYAAFQTLLAQRSIVRGLTLGAVKG
jgi:hypothetical protein